MNSAQTMSGEHGGHEAAAMMAQQNFLSPEVKVPSDLAFFNARAFRFTSPIKTPWQQNNVVHGKLYRAGKDWREKPSVVLLHGWNGELGYYWQFPALGWRLARSGINAAMLELPYHGRRKPAQSGAIQNFISHNLYRMVEATRQASADIRALMAWMAAEGSPSIGIWGISLGAWLGGLVCCHEILTRFGVLMSPVVRMDRAIQDLPFCEPVRRSLEQVSLPLDPFNLVSHRPAANLKHLLVIESQYDLFASVESVEELWAAWGKRDIWRLPHGHISILASPFVMERTVRWIVKHSG